MSELLQWTGYARSINFFKKSKSYPFGTHDHLRFAASNDDLKIMTLQDMWSEFFITDDAIDAIIRRYSLRRVRSSF